MEEAPQLRLSQRNFYNEVVELMNENITKHELNLVGMALGFGPAKIERFVKAVRKGGAVAIEFLEIHVDCLESFDKFKELTSAVDQAGNLRTTRLLLDCAKRYYEVPANIQAQPVSQISLHDACAKRDLQSVQTLLTKPGANVNQADRTGARPLHIAAKNGSIEIVRLLLQTKPEMNALDEMGNTALHVACLAHPMSNNHTAIVKLLLHAGVDLTYVNYDNKSALDIAFEKDHAPVSSAILEYADRHHIRLSTITSGVAPVHHQYPRPSAPQKRMSINEAENKLHLLMINDVGKKDARYIAKKLGISRAPVERIKSGLDLLGELEKRDYFHENFEEYYDKLVLAFKACGLSDAVRTLQEIKPGFFPQAKNTAGFGRPQGPDSAPTISTEEYQTQMAGILLQSYIDNIKKTEEPIPASCQRLGIQINKRYRCAISGRHPEWPVVLRGEEDIVYCLKSLNSLQIINYKGEKKIPKSGKIFTQRDILPAIDVYENLKNTINKAEREEQKYHKQLAEVKRISEKPYGSNPYSLQTFAPSRPPQDQGLRQQPAPSFVAKLKKRPEKPNEIEKPKLTPKPDMSDIQSVAKNELEDMLKCPITLEYMITDPVTVGTYSFSQKALAEWINTRTNQGKVAVNPRDNLPLVNPFTRNPLTAEQVMMFPINLALRTNAQSQQKLVLEKIYEKALDYFGEGDFKRAKEAFEELSMESPENIQYGVEYERTAKVYLDTCNAKLSEKEGEKEGQIFNQP